MTDDVAEPCERCGAATYHGLPDGDRWLCRPCGLREQDDIVIVIGDSATCECGAETHFRHPPDADPNRVTVAGPIFGLPDETGIDGAFSRRVRKAGLWVCPRCLEVFATDECDRCGSDAATNALLGRSGEFCEPCIRAIQDGDGDD